MEATPTHVSNWLAELVLTDGLKPTALKPMLAAIASTFSLLGLGLDLAPCHTAIQGLMNLVPSTVTRYDETWDIDLLIGFWELQPANDELSTSDLLNKCLCLTQAGAIMRASDLERMWLPSLKFGEEGLSYRLMSAKNRDAGLSELLFLSSVPGHTHICPVVTLKEYVERVNTLRSDSNNTHVFISPVKPFSPLKAATLAKRIVKAMNAAGIDTERFKSQSVRSAAASKALDEGETPEAVTKAGRWRSDSVFKKFYERSLRHHRVSRTVLAPRTRRSSSKSSNSQSASRSDD